jgi:hypothetical protein
MSLSLDHKSIIKQLHACADEISIDKSDLENLDSLDEYFDLLISETMPKLIEQIAFLQGLREKIRLRDQNSK